MNQKKLMRSEMKKLDSLFQLINIQTRFDLQIEQEKKEREQREKKLSYKIKSLFRKIWRKIWRKN